MSFLDRVYLLSDWTDISSERSQSTCPCINTSTRSYNRDNCNRAACSSPVFKSCLEHRKCSTCGAYKLLSEFNSGSGRLVVNCIKCRTERREYRQKWMAGRGS